MQILASIKYTGFPTKKKAANRPHPGTSLISASVCNRPPQGSAVGSWGEEVSGHRAIDEQHVSKK